MNLNTHKCIVFFFISFGTSIKQKAKKIQLRDD